jgi:hypothetical protein
MSRKATTLSANSGAKSSSSLSGTKHGTENLDLNPGVKTSAIKGTPGFGPLGLQHLQVWDFNTNTGTALKAAYAEAITQIMYQKNMAGATTLIITMSDPTRKLLTEFLVPLENSNVAQEGTTLGTRNQQFYQGVCIAIKDQGRILHYVLSQTAKAGDQLQLTFEALAVYRLREQVSRVASTTKTSSTAVTQFVQGLVLALNYPGSKYPNVGFVGPDYATIWSKLSGNAGVPIVAQQLSRGTTTDPYEDSWTCIQRIGSTVGWRLWENNGIFYFGPDEYWLGLFDKNSVGDVVPPINLAMGALGKKLPVLQEFTPTTEVMDFDWDVQKPFGQITGTVLWGNGFPYEIGEIVKVARLGPASGNWMVYDMQRDGYSPMATLTLQVPTPYAFLYQPSSLPYAGIPLKSTLTK